ncbi:hypothetical protein A9Q84_14305 [Halobacteriovorax marinus]|mgnify:CR=1 FL=1|uniref:FAD/NAD(P)-binding domain-containing protein n=1 Tax=Halobacteriovorax marinus TaxID=97084 RepID=A0A1Y5F4T1_9BACT|nr:hypothetical protein A9Q84_14305 [Halobacteriovorax marinus]
MKVYDVAVIGSGAAGAMGSLRAVLNNLDTVTFMGSPRTKKSARATWVGKIENMPNLFDKTKGVIQSSNDVFKWINSSDLWKDNLSQVKSSVTKVTGEKGNFELTTDKGETFFAQNILLGTGIMDMQPEIQGSIKPIFPMANAGHIEYCILCDGHKSKGKDTTIIGHDETAGWIATMLFERYENPSMTIVTNGKPTEIKEDSELGKRVKKYGIKIVESPILEILGDAKEEGLVGLQLEDGTIIKTQKGFVSLGVIPHNELALQVGAKVDERGFVVTDTVGESNVPGFFVAGDLRGGKKNQIYTSWDMAVDSVNRIDRYVRDGKRNS